MPDPGSKTMRQIAVESPVAIAVLEKDRLDFCWAGDKSLNAAAAEAGVPLETILCEMGARAFSGVLRCLCTKTS